MKDDSEKLKSEIYRLNVILNKIQTNLGQIHSVDGTQVPMRLNQNN